MWRSCAWWVEYLFSAFLRVCYIFTPVFSYCLLRSFPLTMLLHHKLSCRGPTACFRVFPCPHVNEYLCVNIHPIMQRFHRLFPENETFVAEMERSIFNNGLAALSAPGGSGGQGPNGTGIRYFQNQHKVKQYPSMHASCCEGQGTRLYGKLPEFIFSTLRGGEGGTVTAVYVDIYADATLAFQQTGGGGLGGLEMSTTWPYGDSSVALTLTLSAQSSAFDLVLRIPYWAGAASVPITVNGETWPEEGKPGSYLHLSPWPAGTSTVSFSLRPMSWTPARYTGSSQLPPYARYSYLFGPVLMAFQGPWNSSVDALIMPSGLDPTAPGAWLTGNSGGSLHFSVVGYPNYTVKPYWEVQTAGELFSNYPCFL